MNIRYPIYEGVYRILTMQRKFGKFKRQVFVISNKDLLNSL